MMLVDRSWFEAKLTEIRARKAKAEAEVSACQGAEQVCVDALAELETVPFRVGTENIFAEKNSHPQSQPQSYGSASGYAVSWNGFAGALEEEQRRQEAQASARLNSPNKCP